MSRRLVEGLQKEFGPDILRAASFHGDECVWVTPEKILPVLGHLKHRLACEQLSDIAPVDYPDRSQRFEVNYLLRSLSHNDRIRVKVDVEEGAALDSASGLYRSANWAERESWDMFGIPFRNHPNLRRILCHHEFEGHALRKDYPVEQGQECTVPEKLFDDHAIAVAARRASAFARATGGDELHPSDLLPVNIGPSHPATHGTLRAEVLLDGETIVDARTEIGYLHRCFEKESEDHTWAQVMPYTDRLNYCSAMLNNVIYALAVEKMMGVRVTERCQVTRVIVSELSRIIDHLVCNSANLVDIGALTNYWYLYNVREGIYQIIEKLCGSRLTTNYARIGGMSHDLYEGFEDEVRHHLKQLQAGVKDVMGLIARNRIFLDRTVGVGAISREDAMDYGFTGPTLRACGVDYDLRKQAPYHGYEDYDFEIPTVDTGDTHGRLMLRFAEIEQSRRIVEQALDRLPGGPMNVDDPRVILPPKERVYNTIEGVMNHFKLVYEGIQVPQGESYGFGEAANGELGFLCVSDGSGRPYRLRVRPPCFYIFNAFEQLITGGMIPDAIATLGSLNIIAGELDH
ncbi:MAG: NADH-quinone oxidoreductase subunit D [Candidatus Krumholzibacteriia bacterium]